MQSSKLPGLNAGDSLPTGCSINPTVALKVPWVCVCFREETNRKGSSHLLLLCLDRLHTFLLVQGIFGVWVFGLFLAVVVVEGIP